jgi:hypothetical protein
MSKFYGINPQPATRNAVVKFEDEVMIKKDNRYLLSTLYLDMQEDRWAVAVAYNPSRNSGLHGQENILEVRYSYKNRRGNAITMFRSDMAEESVITAGPFSDPDTFAQYAITFERDLINRPV